MTSYLLQETIDKAVNLSSELCNKRTKKYRSPLCICNGRAKWLLHPYKWIYKHIMVGFHVSLLSSSLYHSILISQFFFLLNESCISFTYDVGVESQWTWTTRMVVQLEFDGWKSTRISHHILERQTYMRNWYPTLL